jgi:hypothetical protein
VSDHVHGVAAHLVRVSVGLEAKRNLNQILVPFRPKSLYQLHGGKLSILFHLIEKQLVGVFSNFHKS